MDKREVLKELELAFASMKKDLGFKTSFDEINEEFSFNDFVLEMGYVRENLVLQLNSRIVDYFRNWASYLNSLMVPNPQSYPNQTESKLFNSEEDKKKMWEIIKICMRYSSMYSLAFLSKDKKLQSEFIDSAYLSWKEEIRPYMSEVIKRVYSGWSEN